MSAAISVPLWLFVALVLLSGWALAVLLLVPGVRWYFRRRVNRVINEINTRLSIELPSFKLTRRRVLIDRLFHDAEVQAAAEAYATQQGQPVVDVRHRVDRYAHEIVPAFNAYLYFRIGYWIAKTVARTLYRVRLGYADEQRLACIDPKSTVVFVMNHRSNMDYVLVAFLAAERVALSYAVGEWARVWPLQSLIRSMGAYFVRRNSGDPLYRTVLARYVAMATDAGVPQAMFPEGGLTLDGGLRKPRFGLLDYMLKGFDPASPRDLVFVPVGINYDRVLEDRSQLMKLDAKGEKPGAVRAAGTTVAFVLEQLGLMLTGRWYRLGYACVNFGTPLSMRAYCAETGLALPPASDELRRAAVTALGERLMSEIANVIPVVPVALVASVFVAAGTRALSELEVKSAAFELKRALAARGAHLYVPRGDEDYAIGVGLRMLTLRHIVTESAGAFALAPEQLPLARYYARSIAAADG